MVSNRSKHVEPDSPDQQQSMFDLLLLTSVTGELEEHGGKYKTKRNSHLICHRLLNSYLNFGTDVPYSLFQSLDFAENAATAGLPLNDWVGMFYDICRVSVAWNAIEVFFLITWL
jgi:hypothetical protein